MFSKLERKIAFRYLGAKKRGFGSVISWVSLIGIMLGVATLIVVTFPVPSLYVSRSLIRLETIVPNEIMMEIMPAQETDTLNSVYMVGHADPSKASGSPKLINEI